MSTRSGTVFYIHISFANVLSEFDASVAAVISAHLLRFEEAWRASKHDGDIPSGFHLEVYHDVNGPYRLYQVRVGPQHGYRVVVMFLDRGSDAYWVSIFKKVKNKQPEDMKRAHIQAQRLWDELQRRNDRGSR